MTSLQEYIGTTKNIFTALKPGDPDSLMDHIGDDVELCHPSFGEFPWGGVFNGRTEFRERLEAFLTWFSSIDQFEQKHFMPDGGVVAMVSSWGRTLKKNGQSVKDIQFIQLFTCDDSCKSVRFVDSCDPTEILDACLRRNNAFLD